MIAPLRRAFERDRLAVALRVLDHRDGVRAARKGCASHDFDALSGLDSRCKVAARAKFADTFETRTGRLRIRGAHRKAVARRTVKGRIVAIGEDGLGQDAAKRLLDFNLRSQRWPRMDPATSITFCRASV